MVCERSVRMQGYSVIFFFNDTATTEIYTLSLHDALPIWVVDQQQLHRPLLRLVRDRAGELGLDHHPVGDRHGAGRRSEEHTSELQSRQYLVCRLLLEKKKSLTLSPYPRTPSHPTRPRAIA